MVSNLQVMLQIFVWIEVRALTVPLKDIYLFVPQPLQWSFGCVLRVIVMLKELPSQFQLSCRGGQQAFLLDISVFCSFHFPFYPDNCPTPH